MSFSSLPFKPPETQHTTLFYLNISWALFIQAEKKNPPFTILSRMRETRNVFRCLIERLL
jgi:hypothetical protein